jgi:hypothetical protein
MDISGVVDSEMTMLERDVQKSITDLLAAERIPCFRMNSGDRFGVTNGKKWRIRGHETGTADLLAAPKIRKGFPSGPLYLLNMRGEDVAVPVFLWIEVKRPGNKQTADQIRFEQECMLRGHAYLCADSVDTVLDWLRERGAING